MAVALSTSSLDDRPTAVKMAASQRVRSVKSFIVGVALIVCFVKYIFVISVNFSASANDPTTKLLMDGDGGGDDDVQLVRLDIGLLKPIAVEKEKEKKEKKEKKGEFVVAVNSDDLDDILNFKPRKQFPQVPHLLLHDPSLCENTPNLPFIIYVHSAPENADRRQLLRQTYANPSLFKNRRFQVIFLLGLPKRRGVQEQVKAEFDKHRDIVQGYFIDDYRNMTLKAVMGLNWIKSHCKNAAFAIKVDDDTFLNIFEMASLLDQNANHSMLVVCPIWREGTMRILRERKSCMKWCVTRREFPGEFYPRYCAGIGYALSQGLVQRMSEAAETTPFFWIDDVYVTGLLTQPLINEIHYVDVMRNFSASDDEALAEYSNTSHSIRIQLVHVGKREKFLLLWKTLFSRLNQDQRNTINDDILKAFT